MTFMVNNPPVWPNSNNSAKQSGVKFLHNYVKDSLVFIPLINEIIIKNCEKRSPTHVLFKPSNVRGIQSEERKVFLKGEEPKQVKESNNCKTWSWK